MVGGAPGINNVCSTLGLGSVTLITTFSPFFIVTVGVDESLSQAGSVETLCPNRLTAIYAINAINNVNFFMM